MPARAQLARRRGPHQQRSLALIHPPSASAPPASARSTAADSPNPPQRLFYLTTAVLFVIAAAATLYFLHSMSGNAMDMPMPGDWTMSMTWMSAAMPLSAASLASALIFLAMWQAMMLAMMLPSSLPMLLLFRRVAIFRHQPGAHAGVLTWALGSAYFFVWLCFGAIAYLIGTGIARAAMASDAVSRSIPFAAAGALILAGAYQLTPWKSACLQHCRDPLLLVANHSARGIRGAVNLGLHHGLFCTGCCWGLMLVQLVVGVMDLRMMVVVAAIIAAEKLFVRGPLVARISGAAAILAGIALSYRALHPL